VASESASLGGAAVGGAIAKVAQLKHERIAAALEREIRSGQLPHGSQLPGEVVLAGRFRVSRNTVRAALAELADAGLIETRTGKGSYVVFDGRPLDARQGWARALARQGVETEVTVLRFEQYTDEFLAEKLGISATSFIALDRIRRIAGGPAISYERSQIPAIPAFRDLPRVGLKNGSLTQTLVGAGLAGHHGDQWVRSRRLTQDEAELLGRSTKEWFLHTRRITWTLDGQFCEHAESTLDPAHFRLHLRFQQDD